jgi:hypothetical protein
MSIRELPVTPKCTVGNGQLELQFYQAEANGPEAFVGGPKGTLI